MRPADHHPHLLPLLPLLLLLLLVLLVLVLLLLLCALPGSCLGPLPHRPDLLPAHR
jgi:hypothetical protein